MGVESTSRRSLENSGEQIYKRFNVLQYPHLYGQRQTQKWDNRKSFGIPSLVMMGRNCSPTADYDKSWCSPLSR